MKINIAVKGYSNKESAIVKLIYEYERPCATIKELLEETVQITLDRYLEDAKAAEILKVLSNEEIEEKAREHKISFGIRYNEGKADEAQAIENALQCFDDGMVALFINDRQYEDLSDSIELKEEDTLTFIKLAFLAGRMW